MDVINLVSDDKTNQELNRRVSKEEVRDAIFFPWDIIKYDLVHVVVDFNRTSKILKELSQTYTVMVPKTGEPTHLEEFRPFNLCNTIYKIISKVAVNCIKPILDKAISPTWNGFSLGHQFLDIVITSQKVLHFM